MITMVQSSSSCCRSWYSRREPKLVAVCLIARGVLTREEVVACIVSGRGAFPWNWGCAWGMSVTGVGFPSRFETPSSHARRCILYACVLGDV